MTDDTSVGATEVTELVARLRQGDVRALARAVSLVENDARNFVQIAATAANAEIVSPDFHLVTPQKVAAAHRAGVQVVPWTADTPADWDMLVKAKVDAIISDDPAELIAYLKNSGQR